MGVNHRNPDCTGTWSKEDLHGRKLIRCCGCSRTYAYTDRRWMAASDENLIGWFALNQTRLGTIAMEREKKW